MTEDKDTTIICPKCLKEMDIKDCVKGSGESAEFTCPFCGEKGKNPLD